MIKSPFPFITEGVDYPEDGYIFPLSPICHEMKLKCKAFYQSLSKEPGYVQCPFGFVCFSKYFGERFISFTGLKIQGVFDRQKLKTKDLADLLPVISKNRFEKIVDDYESIYNDDMLVNESLEFSKQSFHEIRKIIRDIRGSTELISMATEFYDQSKLRDVQLNNSVIYDLVSLMIKRMDFFDIQANPDLVCSSQKENIEIFKKFDKTIKCLRSYCRIRKVDIELTGSCFFAINGYEIFDILPYLLLENASKYTSEYKNIIVNFNFSPWAKTVTISNYGPMLDSQEINFIFRKGYRGMHARSINRGGSGTGLFFAKKICEMHNIEISATSSSQISFNLGKIPYSLFTITLDFNNIL